MPARDIASRPRGGGASTLPRLRYSLHYDQPGHRCCPRVLHSSRSPDKKGKHGHVQMYRRMSAEEMSPSLAWSFQRMVPNSTESALSCRADISGTQRIFRWNPLRLLYGSFCHITLTILSKTNCFPIASTAGGYADRRARRSADRSATTGGTCLFRCSPSRDRTARASASPPADSVADCVLSKQHHGAPRKRNRNSRHSGLIFSSPVGFSF